MLRNNRGFLFGRFLLLALATVTFACAGAATIAGTAILAVTGFVLGLIVLSSGVVRLLRVVLTGVVRLLRVVLAGVVLAGVVRLLRVVLAGVVRLLRIVLAGVVDFGLRSGFRRFVATSAATATVPDTIGFCESEESRVEGFILLQLRLVISSVGFERLANLGRITLQSRNFGDKGVETTLNLHNGFRRLFFRICRASKLLLHFLKGLVDVVDGVDDCRVVNTNVDLDGVAVERRPAILVDEHPREEDDSDNDKNEPDETKSIFHFFSPLCMK